MERSWRKRENNDQSDESKSLYNELLVTSIKLKKKKKERKEMYIIYSIIYSNEFIEKKTYVQEKQISNFESLSNFSPINFNVTIFN